MNMHQCSDNTNKIIRKDHGMSILKQDSPDTIQDMITEAMLLVMLL